MARVSAFHPMGSMLLARRLRLSRAQLSLSKSSIPAEKVHYSLINRFLKKSQIVRETVRLYEGSWSAAGNSIVMDLVRGDTVMIALSENGKVVDGIYNYFTVSLAEPA